MILGSGVDVIQAQRTECALERFGERFERRVFREAEIRPGRRHRRPALQYALRFAAKEALMKAFGSGWARGLALILHGRVARLASRRGAGRTHLDVGRSGTLALAMLALEGGAA